MTENPMTSMSPGFRLQERGLAPGTINLRMAAVRRLAYEAADSGLLTAKLAAGIHPVKGVRKLGSGYVPDRERRLAAGPSKPAPGWLEAIDAQIRDEIAVMQGVVVSDLRQDEHLVRLDAKEVRRVIEVRIGEPGVHAIAVIERAFKVGDDLGLRNLRGSRGRVRFTLDV